MSVYLCEPSKAATLQSSVGKKGGEGFAGGVFVACTEAKPHISIRSQVSAGMLVSSTTQHSVRPVVPLLSSFANLCRVPTYSAMCDTDVSHTGVDSSAPALELANSNAQLNGWQPSQYSFLKDDIMKYMQQQAAEGALWDLVVLDPPKLAPNRKSLNRALVKYRKLNTLVGDFYRVMKSAA